MTASDSTDKRKKTSPVPAQRRNEPSTTRRWWYLLGALGVVVIGSGLLALTRPSEPAGPSEGLPRTPDYHSLLVSQSDPLSVVLGTHDGLFHSGDGGLTWERAALSGRDAMSLSRPTGGSTVWAAGHNVLARSDDDGATWEDVRPDGLPGLDVHGFATDPSNPSVLYAAIAGEGVYRSSDNGNTFQVVSTEVGPGVMALAVLATGTVLAGDMQQQALLSSADQGTTWSAVAQAPIMGLAVNPKDSRRVLASGPGVLLSTDGGATWNQALQHDAGTGPIAWATSDPRIGYVVGLDRTLFRTDDTGQTWIQVEEGS